MRTVLIAIVLIMLVMQYFAAKSVAANIEEQTQFQQMHRAMQIDNAVKAAVRGR